MNRFLLRFAAVLLLLAISTRPTLGESVLPPDTSQTDPVQVVMPVLNYRLSMPLISRPDLSGLIGPFGGSVVVILPDPTNPDVVYAGSWGAGVYKSTDRGVTWQPARSGLTNLYINSMAIDPQNTQVVYAGTYKSGVFKSVDGGANWAPVNNGIQAEAIVYCMAVDPEVPTRLYAGTRGVNTTGLPPWKGVLYKSEDGGASWKAVLQNIGGTDQQDWIYSLAVLPRDPNMILAASHEHGPYLSTDYGKTWAPANNGITDGSGRAVLFDPRYRNPSTAFFGVWHRTGLFKSTDDAATWKTITAGIADTKIYSMAIDPLDPNHLYATTFIASTGDVGGVLQSADSGQTWKPGGLAGYSIYTVAIDSANSSRLYAGVFNTGLYRSDDRGANWAPSENGLSNVPVSAVLVWPGAPDRVITAAATVLQTFDRGQNWAAPGGGLPAGQVNALAMSPANPNLIFALTQSSGLYRIDLSSGSGWSKLTAVPSVPTLQSDPRPAQPEQDELHMLMPDEPTAPAPSEPATLPSAAMLAMAFAPSNPAVAYLGTSGSGVYRSTDGGGTWNPAGLSGQVVTSLAVDSADPNTLYAATGAAGTVKVSLNGGQTWADTALPGVTPYALSTSPAEPGTVYAGTSSGVYKRVGSGAWTLSGLAGKPVTALAAHSTQAGLVFAGTNAGAFVSKDGGTSWSAGPAGLSAVGIKSIAIEPVNGINVYYATAQSGVYMQYWH